MKYMLLLIRSDEDWEALSDGERDYEAIGRWWADGLGVSFAAGAEGWIDDDLAFVKLAGVKADRADQELPATVRVLLKQPCQRWASLAGDCLGVTREGKPDRLLGQPHRDRLAPLKRRTTHQERDGHAFRILKSGRQIDQHLPTHYQTPSLDPPTA